MTLFLHTSHLHTNTLPGIWHIQQFDTSTKMSIISHPYSFFFTFCIIFPTQNLCYIWERFCVSLGKTFPALHLFIHNIGEFLHTPRKIPRIYLGKDCVYPHASWYSGFPKDMGRIFHTPTQKLSYIYGNLFSVCQCACLSVTITSKFTISWWLLSIEKQPRACHGHFCSVEVITKFSHS